MSGCGRLALVLVLVAALGVGVASPASAARLARTARLLVRFVQARQAIDRARALRERLLPVPGAEESWRSVEIRGSTTAPASPCRCPRQTPEPRPRGPQR